MGGDYTRFPFDPMKGFSGVLEQQGRVALDSDHNEFEEILDRLRRAGTYDVLGPAVPAERAVVPMTTPDGFKISVAAGGVIRIGRGRAYVHGIQVECFGDVSTPPLVYDAALGGEHGAGPLNYDTQPFRYGSGFPAPSTTTGTTDLVYLDAWQREVIDPDLREPALNGADTVTHVQSAWQVKVLQNVDGGACGDPLPAAWATLTAPSTGRLTVKGTQTPPATTPCEIDPVDGYTGLENRLYRVEIHDAGSAGGGGTTATFKWSRDNASLMAGVTAIVKEPSPGTGSVLSVVSTGRDSWTRFAEGDHVEVLDDAFELAMRETGTGGRMAKVTKVDPAAGTLTIDDDLSTVFGATPAPAGLRVRLWSHVDPPQGSPLEPLTRPATGAVTLEEGIQITFDGGAAGPGPAFHAGDHWLFAARTADGSVEEFEKAPPRGVLHHFARLARVTVGEEPKDCRVIWPREEGCCTAVVRPGEDIQAAIDSLDGIGGCVCLKMGVHQITAPLRIRQGNLTLHGEVPVVTVRRTAGGPHMLDIEAAAGSNVSVHSIRFEGTASDTASEMITVNGLAGGSISDCELWLAGATAEQEHVGIVMKGCQRLTVEGCSLGLFSTGIAAEDCGALRISGNIAVGLNSRGGDATTGLPGDSLGRYGIRVGGATLAHTIDGNTIHDFRRGIEVGDPPPPDLSGSALPAQAVAAVMAHTTTRVSENVVLRRGDASDGQGNVAIAVHVAGSEIRRNAALMPTATDIGIMVAGADALVEGNAVLSPETGSGRTIPHGIVAYSRTDDALGCTIRGNAALGLQRAILAVAPLGAVRPAGADRLDIVENRIAFPPEARDAASADLPTPGLEVGNLTPFFLVASPAASILVVGVHGARIEGNVLSDPVCGIFASGGEDLRITENVAVRPLFGVALVNAQASQVTRNTVDAAGFNRTVVVGVLSVRSPHAVLRGNSLTAMHFGIASVEGASGRVEENVVRGGTVGIIASAGADITISGNHVEDTIAEGISSTMVTGRQVLAHNRAVRCGYTRESSDGSRAATGIAVLQAEDVVIESCHVLDTGEAPPSGGLPFRGPRRPVVVGAQSARLHACVVTSPPLSGTPRHPASRGVFVLPGGGGAGATRHADMSDNLVEQEAVTLVEVRIRAGEVILSANRCTNISVEPPGDATVKVSARQVVATGNRVAVVETTPQVPPPPPQPSLEISAVGFVSVVGNMTTDGATINVPTTRQRPRPYQTFNIVN